MILHCDIGGKPFEADLATGIDIALSFGPGGDNPNAFGIPEARIAPFSNGDFVGSVQQGSGANCDVIQFCAHGNGTHTECIGHITKSHEKVSDCIKSNFIIADLITVDFETVNGKTYIPLIAMRSLPLFPAEAIIIRSKPNGVEKKNKSWSGNQPPFFDLEVIYFLREKGYQHLLTDLPSIDPEHDNGELAAHHIWWNYPENPRKHASITELIYVPNEVADGLYILNLQFPKIQSDAAPSKPVIFPLIAK